MPGKTIHQLLDQLDEAKRSFGSGTRPRLAEILTQLQQRKFTDADSLIRFHEILIFICAYPQNAQSLRKAEKALASFTDRLQVLRNNEADLSPLDNPEVSGIAGTSVIDTFSFYIVRWLVGRQPGRVSLDWDWFEDENRLGAAWPRFMPLLEEDASVEANVPYLEWLRAASGRVKDLAWLIQRFESLPRTDKEKAELYEAQKLYVHWTPGQRATRTGMRLPVRQIFYHRRPLIQRRDLSFREELESPPPPLKLLSAKQGAAVLEMAREASTTRYRELYGFTHGDPEKVFKTNPGRGVDVFIMGLPPNRRLPLRAYHAAMIFKNGVPVGYFEGLSLFERMESGFNLYYTFRDGETAWLYARTLNIFRHLLGVTAFAIDPYQIGYKNEEGIESGAFWFYRKLGFRPTNRDVARLVSNEEKKMVSRPAYRTSAQRLRKLAAGSMIFELDSSRTGDWDRFQVRNIGLAVQRRMAGKFAGNAERIRGASVKKLNQILGLTETDWRATEMSVLSDFAVTLSLIDDLPRWSNNEKETLVRVVRAKAGSDESSYLKLMQRHERLRSAIVRLGS